MSAHLQRVCVTAAPTPPPPLRGDQIGHTWRQREWGVTAPPAQPPRVQRTGQVSRRERTFCVLVFQRQLLLRLHCASPAERRGSSYRLSALGLEVQQS